MENEIKLHNPTLRVIEVLECVAKSEKGVSLSEISKYTDIPKGTLHPIVLTLLERGYLATLHGQYVIGKDCFKIGYRYLHSFDYISIFQPHMKSIVHKCDEICQLGILDGLDVLYLHKSEPEQAIRIESSAGKNLRAYATALGKCMLSYKTDVEIRDMYKDVACFAPYTENTVHSIEALINQLEFVRKHGYFHEVGETNKDVECVGVPIRNNDKIICAISVSLPRFRSTPSKIASIIDVLKAEADIIEQEIKILPLSSWK